MNLAMRKVVAEALLARIAARRDADTPGEWVQDPSVAVYEGTRLIGGERFYYEPVFRGWVPTGHWSGDYEAWARGAAQRADVRRRQARFLRRILGAA